MLVARTEMAPT